MQIKENDPHTHLLIDTVTSTREEFNSLMNDCERVIFDEDEVACDEPKGSSECIVTSRLKYMGDVFEPQTSQRFLSIMAPDPSQHLSAMRRTVLSRLKQKTNERHGF